MTPNPWISAVVVALAAVVTLVTIAAWLTYEWINGILEELNDE